eukprot:4947250-Prymnesium_polylepis.1
MHDSHGHGCDDHGCCARTHTTLTPHRSPPRREHQNQHQVWPGPVQFGGTLWSVWAISCSSEARQRCTRVRR